ncbi:MAG TPA: hypothetical protein VHQ64_11570 [Pyrinomonadaceae bacterium]|nr:hypothetical protein [Pyrinomonadaceae bacterium]
MITGYNTDVEFDGVVYHVQTEDKGLRTPLILSLVYVKGEILAAKRAPYDDLIAGGFDEKILVQRLERQHKLICAAVHAGRIEDLKRMSGREAVANASAAAEETHREPLPPAPEPAPGLAPPEPAPPELALPEPEPPVEAPPVAEAPAAVNLSQYAFDAPLAIFLVDEPEFIGGASVELKILVMRATNNVRLPAANVKVIVKTLSTAFSPGKIEATTDERGFATAALKFPKFRSGRAAVLVQVEHEGTRAELRRIIVPGK